MDHENDLKWVANKKKKMVLLLKQFHEVFCSKSVKHGMDSNLSISLSSCSPTITDTHGAATGNAFSSSLAFS